MKRRTFIKKAALASATVVLSSKSSFASSQKTSPSASTLKHPIILSTWDFGKAIHETAFKTLLEGGSILDAVENAVKIPEADPKITSVGYGGYPDRDGKVTLDACIMDGNGNCGSVVFLEHIIHPVSIARLVMEKTPHVMLAGEGALQFALENGFKKENLLTKEAEDAYKEWLKTSKYVPLNSDQRNHDTIGLIAMDINRNVAGACTTSGMAWKIHGRVGDSPLIGAGLYVDNEVGAATATGVGETVIKIAGSFLIVELMRNGKSPQEACRLAIERLIKKNPKYKNDNGFLAGFIALNKAGEVGGCSYGKGLQYTIHKDGEWQIIDAEYLKKS